jgi:predicted RND superfamily exporter protein
MISTENAYSKEHLKELQNLHKKIDSIPNVNATFSLAKAEYPIFANNKMYFKNVFTEKRSEKAITNLLKKLPGIRDNLVAENNTKSIFFIQLKPLVEIESNKDELLHEIRKNIDSEIDDYKITGAPLLVQEINKSVSQESLFFIIFISILVTILLFLILPRIAYLPVALVTASVPVIILFGIIVILGYKLNMISMLIPTILIVYAVSDVIHIINIYHIHITEFPNQNKNEQIKEALYKSLKPCFYTTITTIVGYLALCLSPLPVFKFMGVFTFIGLIITFSLAYVTTAIGLSLITNKTIDSSKSFQFNFIKIEPILHKINYITTHFKKTLLIVFSLIFIVGVYSVSLIEVNSYSVDLLHEGEAKEDLKTIEKTLKGAFRLGLDISSKDKTSLINDKSLLLIEKFQNEIKKNKELAAPISIIDFKQFVEKRYHIKTSTKSIPIDSLNYDKTAFFKLVSDDFSRISINVNAKSLSSKYLKILLGNIEQSFNTIFKDDPNIELKINGSSPLYIKMHDYILVTQLRSFSTAMFVAFLILIYFIKNIRTSFLALLPNLLPLALTAIVMVIFNIPIEASNAMIAPIMIGIAMDDTIHLIHKYKQYKSEGLSVIESMDKAMLFVGRALLTTTITLVFGFSILMFSKLINMQEFGFLCAITILFALVADGVVLPALIKTFDK